jgi:hypothetical protein
VARPQRGARRHEHGLVSGAADLKEDSALVAELDFFVIQPPRPKHH